MLNLKPPPPLSLYIHIPWCVRKCPYCDFNSHEARTEIPEQAYIDALLRDLEQDLPRVWEEVAHDCMDAGGRATQGAVAKERADYGAEDARVVHTVFLGGGTPSLFSPEAIDRLLSSIRERVPLKPDAEVTLEANPGTIDTERFKGFRDAGVNRLSVGIQSFDPEKLKALGRIHGRTEALRAAEAARAAGFENINLDLMYGLPRQTVDQVLADVRTAIDMQPAHLSMYQLTIEPNTLFHAKPPALPDDDTSWEMQNRMQDMLVGHGYKQYEVSAYAKPGYECRHNLNYWRFGDYLGIGAGAHGKITGVQGITRIWKVKHPGNYMEKAGAPTAIGGINNLMPQDAAAEFLLNALRLMEGFASSLFQERTGLSLSTVEESLRLAETKGLLSRDNITIRPTELGRRFLNDLQMLFLPEASRHNSQSIIHG
ncbi:MAG: radical SAM family heme chaperone HemW [Gammaproteobacteria bacterium]|nr:MAG: radical SAM family heme chaperone HemW [Gammaproteobacteria bacterium]